MTHESVGSFLRGEREHRRMSLIELSRLTRIPAGSLASIESDRFDELPGEVFVRGFLKAYAQAVGIVPAEVLARYTASGRVAFVTPMPLSSTVQTARYGRQGRRFGVAIAFVAAPHPLHAGPVDRAQAAWSRRASRAVVEDRGRPRERARLKAVRSHALLLRSVVIGESDLVVTLLTEREGKVGASFRYGRKSTRRAAGGVEPFHTLDVLLEDRGRDLLTLKESRLATVRAGVVRSLEAMDAAGAVLRWARHLLPSGTPIPPRGRRWSGCSTRSTTRRRGRAACRRWQDYACCAAWATRWSFRAASSAVGPARMERPRSWTLDAAGSSASPAEVPAGASRGGRASPRRGPSAGKTIRPRGTVERTG